MGKQDKGSLGQLLYCLFNPGYLLTAILSRPVGVACEKHDAAAVRTEATKEAQDKSYVSDMANLKRLVVAVTSNLRIGNEVPVKGISDDGAEGRLRLIGDILDDFASKLMNGSEAREVKLVNGDLRAGIPSYRLP